MYSFSAYIVVVVCHWTMSYCVSPSASGVSGHSDLHWLGAPRPGGLRHPAVLFLLFMALDLGGSHLLLDVQARRLPGQHLCNAKTDTHTHTHTNHKCIREWGTNIGARRHPVKIMSYWDRLTVLSLFILICFKWSDHWISIWKKKENPILQAVMVKDF